MKSQFVIWIIYHNKIYHVSELIFVLTCQNGLCLQDIQDVFADVPSSEVPKGEFEGEGIPLVNLLATVGVATSRGNARRLIEGGGIYVNNIRVNDAARAISLVDSIEGRFLVLRKGKKNYHLVQVI